MSTTNEITIGADPEFFLQRDNKPVSAHDVVPGTKLQPYPLKRGVSIQADGTAVEFNIKPCRTREEFADSIQDALDQIRREIPSEYSFSFTPTVNYDKDYFDKLPSSAVELGCSPDFRALVYGKKSLPPRDTGTMRAAGGHIHIGWGDGLDVTNKGHFFDCVILCKALDQYYSMFRHHWDDDTRRQFLYGGGGAFRPKPYGAEYRGLSNAWLRYPKLWPWIFDSTTAIFKHLKEYGHKRNPLVRLMYDRELSAAKDSGLYYRHLTGIDTPADFPKLT